MGWWDWVGVVSVTKPSVGACFWWWISLSSICIILIGVFDLIVFVIVAVMLVWVKVVLWVVSRDVSSICIYLLKFIICILLLLLL